MNLTPKEKAKELIERFEKVEVVSADHIACASIDTKQCALIAIGMALDYSDFHCEYLQQTKTEIEKL
jgi:hypothetical protein